MANTTDTERIGALAGIGNTPLIKLSRMVASDQVEVWVKLEAANPTGSYEDRYLAGSLYA